MTTTFLYAQDTLIELRPVKILNLDSLRADSIRKVFILNHRPLTQKQLYFYKRPIRKSVYGNAVTSFIDESMYFKEPPGVYTRALTYRLKPSFEWIFYSYVFLFLFLALILSLSPAYIKVVIELIFKKSFNQDKSRETKLNTSLPSLMMNILFIMASSFFIYFSLNKVYGYDSLNQLGFILSCALVIAVIYLFKYFFLQICGWLFKQKAIFDHYFSYLSLVYKAIGLALLVASVLIAFGKEGFSAVIFTLSIFLIIVLLFIRLVNAFFIFSKPFKIGITEFLIGFFSIEILPTLVFLKFLQENSVVLLTGFL